MPLESAKLESGDVTLSENLSRYINAGLAVDDEENQPKEKRLEYYQIWLANLLALFTDEEEKDKAISLLDNIFGLEQTHDLILIDELSKIDTNDKGLWFNLLFTLNNIHNGKKYQYLKTLKKVLTISQNISFLKNYDCIFSWTDILSKNFTEEDLEVFFNNFLKPLIEKKFSQKVLSNLISLSCELKSKKINPTAFLPFIVSKKNLVESEDFIIVKQKILDLAEAQKKSRKLSLERIIDMLAMQELSSLKQLARINLLIENGIYPTPHIVRTILLQKDENLSKFLENLSKKMHEMRQIEKINPGDPIDLEMYYAFLNVNISFDKFEKVIQKIDKEYIGKLEPKWQTFRVRVQGVELIEKDLDENKINGIRQEIISKMNPKAGFDCIKGFYGLPKNVLDKDAKAEMLIDLITIITKEMTQGVYGHESYNSPYTKTNVLGYTETVLQMPPSYQKIAFLKYGIYELTNYIKDTNTVKKDPKAKYVEKELKVFNDNIKKAEDLIKICKNACIKEAKTLLVNIDISTLNPRDLNTISELYMDLYFNQNRNEDEVKLIESLGLLTEKYCVDSLERNEKILKKSLIIFAEKLYLSALKNKEAQNKLFEVLQMICLNESNLTLSEIEEMKPDQLLETAYDLYKEKTTTKLDEISKSISPDRGFESAAIVVDKILNDMPVQEAYEIMRKIKSNLDGMADMFDKKSDNDQLKAKFRELRDSLLKKFKEIQKGYVNPPKEIQRNYNRENTRFLHNSLRHHISKTIEHILKIPDLTANEKNTIESFKSRLVKHKENVKVIETFLAILHNFHLETTTEQSVSDLNSDVLDIEKKTRKELNNYPIYLEFRKKHENLVRLQNEEKRTLKEKMYTKYLEEHGSGFNPVDFNAILSPLIKEIDKKYSNLIKENRTNYEQKAGDSAVKINLWEKFLNLLNTVKTHLKPLEIPQRKTLQNIETELNKLSYADLDEDEYEFVPKRNLGDALKGWVSQDCSKDYPDHIENVSFINYRIYRKEHNERQWIGNIYVLDAYFNDSPVLIIDAFQVNTSVSLNAKQFMERAMRGFEAMALNMNYKFILSNHINTVNEGWLISNRGQFRKAYMELYEKNDRQNLKEGEVNLKDSRAAKFQFFRDPKAVILWKHPDLKPVIELEKLCGWLAALIPLQLINKLKIWAKKDNFGFISQFQSKRGYEHLKSLENKPAELILFMTFMELFNDFSDAWPIFYDEKRFKLLQKFHNLNPKLDKNAAEFLIFGNSADRIPFLEKLLNYSNEEKGINFISKVLSHNIYSLKVEDLDDLYTYAIAFKKIGFENEFLKTCEALKSGELKAMNEFKNTASSLLDGEISKSRKDAVLFILNNRLFLRPEPVIELIDLFEAFDDNEDMMTVFACMERRFDLPIELLKEIGLSTKKDNNRSKYQKFLLKQFIDSNIKTSRDIEKALFIYEKLDLFNERTPKDGERPEQWDINIINLCFKKEGVEKLYQLFKIFFNEFNKPDSGKFELKYQYCRQFAENGNIAKALFIAKAPDEMFEDFYFLAWHLSDEEISKCDDIPSLREQFIKNNFDNSALNKFPSLRNLVVSGTNFMFVREDLVKAFKSNLNSGALRTMERAQLGETEIIKRKKLDEEIKSGYKNLEDFFNDQQTIYSLEFHK